MLGVLRVPQLVLVGGHAFTTTRRSPTRAAHATAVAVSATRSRTPAASRRTSWPRPSPIRSAGRGWYDDTASDTNGGGEIADICVNPFNDTKTINGQTVQTLWSNSANACIASRPPNNDDYTLVAAPTTASVALGATTTIQISTMVTVGSAEPITLTASGQSNGLTATIDPPAINSGETATLTLTAAPDADQVRVAIDINAAVNPNYSHDQTVTITVGTPGDFLDRHLAGVAAPSPPAARSCTTSRPRCCRSSIGNIDLTTVSLPTNVGGSFDPPTIAAGGSSVLTVVTGGAALPGQTRFQVQGANLGTIHAANAEITLTAADAGPVAPTVDATPPPPTQPDAALAADAAPTPTPNSSSSCTIAVGSGTSPVGVGFLVAGLVLGIGMMRRRSRH